MTDFVTPTDASDADIPAPEEAHVEGGPGCRWYKVRMTEEAFAALGLRVEWGQPDADGFHTPTVRSR